MTHDHQINLNELPPALRQLVKVIGMDAAWRLVSERGGRTLYIPKQPTLSKLTKVIGQDALAALCRAYGGTTIELPKDDSITRQVRNREIQAAYESGVTQSELANRYRLTRRQIINIVHSADDDHHNLSLF